MAKGGGKKGNPFEREICRQLTAWWTGDPDRDVAFWRTAGSGGRATRRQKLNKATIRAHCGDIGACDPVGDDLMRFVAIECKRGYNTATLHDLLDRGSCQCKQTPYEEWIEQAMNAAKISGARHWMIIHRRDKHETLVTYSGGMASDLGLFTRNSILVTPIRVNGEETVWQLESMTWGKFLREVRPARIRELLKVD